MQTKQQIQRLLSSAGVSPNKRLGQHFLIDLNVMRLLVESADIGTTDVVVEVGCGTGSLTAALAERAGYCVAVELDPVLAAIAKTQVARFENVQVINTDILESKNAVSGVIIDAIEGACERCSGALLLVSNLPYNVASPVVLNFAAGRRVVDRMCVTVQKEVADRMTAGPGSREYGVLSVFLAATGDVRRIRILKPSVFWPQPQVGSAMVSFTRKKENAGRLQNAEAFREVVHLFMGHRRKTLRACTKLASGRLAGIDNWPEILDQCSLEAGSRPGRLSAEAYIAIANLCHNCLAGQ